MWLSLGGLILLATARGILYSMPIVIEYVLGMLIGSMGFFAFVIELAVIGRFR